MAAELAATNKWRFILNKGHGGKENNKKTKDKLS